MYIGSAKYVFPHPVARHLWRFVLDSINHYREKLIAASSDCSSYVKQLRLLRLDRLASRFVDLTMNMHALAADKRHFKNETYIRRAVRLLDEYDQLISHVTSDYGLAKSTPIIQPPSSSTRTVRISITLQVDQWDKIDRLIADKRYHSRSHYFRKLLERMN